jgi:hypothetical protein
MNEIDKGLYGKYIVHKNDLTPIYDCFVLRPDKDLSAVVALRAYAAATENKKLAEDIYNWIGRLEYKKSLGKQLSGGWIPVSERLPENQPSWIGGTTYIITLKTQNTIVRFAKYKEKKWIGDFGKIISDDDVIAWQPLPEPFKEVEK